MELTSAAAAALDTLSQATRDASKSALALLAQQPLDQHAPAMELTSAAAAAPDTISMLSAKNVPLLHVLALLAHQLLAQHVHPIELISAQFVTKATSKMKTRIVSHAQMTLTNLMITLTVLNAHPTLFVRTPRSSHKPPLQLKTAYAEISDASVPMDYLSQKPTVHMMVRSGARAATKITGLMAAFALLGQSAQTQST